MAKLNRCPRCGGEYEDDFCPQCDLHYTDHGVFRPSTEEKHQHKQDKTIKEKEKTVQTTSIFGKRQSDDQQFSKEIFNKTVGEVIEENHLDYDYQPVLTSFKETLPSKEEIEQHTKENHSDEVASLDDVKAHEASRKYDVERDDIIKDHDDAIKDEVDNHKESSEEVTDSHQESLPAVSNHDDSDSEPALPLASRDDKGQEDAESQQEASEQETVERHSSEDDSKELEDVEAQEEQLLNEALKEPSLKASSLKKPALPKQKESEKGSMEDYQPQDHLHQEEEEQDDLHKQKQHPQSEEHKDNEQAIEEKLKQNQHRQKRMIIIMSCILIVAIVSGSVFAYTSYRHKQNQMIMKKESAIEKRIDAFYVNQDASQGYLKKTVTKEDLQPVVDLIDTLKTKDAKEAQKMEEQLAVVEANSELEEKVNQLFVSPKIKGNKVNDVAIKEDVSIQLVEKKNPSNAFEKAVNASIKDAKAQQKTMDEAKTLVQALITQDTVAKNATMKKYKKAKEAVSHIENTSVKKSLNQQLKTVKATIEERNAEKEAEEARKAAEKKAKEAQEKAEAEAKKVASETPKAIKKANADPTNGTITDDDSSDPYHWVPGVKEKVINTCVSRGYITPSTYSLRKAYTLNGDGYYNLYSTKNGSKPTYLVTINCKTGWFKGNG